MVMDTILMQQTFQRLLGQYDHKTARQARIVHSIYLDGMRGVPDCGKELSMVIMNSNIVPEARGDFLQYCDFVRKSISQG